MSLPFVSVVMPVFNCAHYVAEAVASVRAQAWPELELIAVDDGSTDHTPEILEALAADRANRMRVVRTINQGPAAARNHALGLVRGPFIAFIDADDLWPEDKLEVQLGRFRLQPELEIVLGLVAVHGMQGYEGSTRRFDPIGTPVIAANIGSGVYRTSAFHRVGGFDESLRFGEDVDWNRRAIEARLPLVLLDRATLIYRLHDANMTLDSASVRRGTMLALKRSLDRRRAAGASHDLPSLAHFLERGEPRCQGLGLAS